MPVVGCLVLVQGCTASEIEVDCVFDRLSQYPAQSYFESFSTKYMNCYKLQQYTYSIE